MISFGTVRQKKTFAKKIWYLLYKYQNFSVVTFDAGNYTKNLPVFQKNNTFGPKFFPGIPFQNLTNRYVAGSNPSIRFLSFKPKNVPKYIIFQESKSKLSYEFFEHIGDADSGYS